MNEISNNDNLAKGEAGVVCNELYTRDIPGTARLFTELFGFVVIREEDGFWALRSRRAALLLNDGHDLASDHPFFGKVTGSGHGQCVEIVVAVENLDTTYEAARLFTDCAVTPIKLQEWGIRDFRLTTKEGFYLRVTEPFQ